MTLSANPLLSGPERKHLEVAISNPCRISSECVHPKFAYLIPGASVVLTVNSGYE